MTDTTERRSPSFTRITGQRLPAWLWRDLHAATRAAPHTIPVLLVEERGGRRLICFDADDWHALLAGEEHNP